MRVKLRRPRIYVAGQMTGIPACNFPAFHEAALRLADAGWDVANPADNFGGRTDLPRHRYIAVDLEMLLNCDAIALLPGWENSPGARMECLIATELSMPVYDAATCQPMEPSPSVTTVVEGMQPAAGDDESILDEARRITSSERQRDYGHPIDDFNRTALLWSGILASKLRPGAQISAGDVPLCMIAVKLARHAHRSKRDNLVDIAGYAQTAAMLTGDEGEDDG